MLRTSNHHLILLIGEPATQVLDWPPRSYVERVYNIERWTEMPRGGHFAALEQPDLLVEDIRAFARSLR